ncbi:outer membrane protein assembly factor BamB family protein [Actinoplanes regularis]|uniref:Outer membrane protein assembly factor BamB, contains PQQ-like beta-propeller repeat n=1 Tax=Actinoplanes regularis TaxID=52697 RepID=A0A238WL08_9ACTN|nr:PQQ-binding-like beta-propeller repeat protein [Actinoplanes regularis]GIE84768.1 hypothetical protein Are01nite_12480 [Actinoplanes regularis]SNR47245.1 Outer membrane protein assembly factor BamB, contains PQQ-like beta-propeller repeat [Actinoplanes regularis]
MIDLDAAPPPGAERPLRVPWRKLRIAVVAVALSLLGAAAAPPRPRVFPEVTNTGGRGVVAVLLTPEALYTVHHSVDEEVELVARPLAPGGPSWSVQLSLNTMNDLLLTRSGSVLTISDDVSSTVLDAGTGRERWSAPSWASPRVVGNRVLLAGSDDAGSGRLELADVETGRILWTRPGDASDALLDATGRYLLTLDGGGNVQVRSALDGRPLARRRLDDESIDLRTSIRLVGDRVYVFGTATVTAFHLPGLTPAWPAPGSVLMPSDATTCGDLVCVVGRRGISALDPVTGTTRWSSPDRMFYAGAVVRALDGRNVLLDPATGRVVRRLGRGMVAGGLMLRQDGDTGTQVTDLRTGQVYGSLPGVLPFGCVAAGEYLACSRHGGTVVFRVREAS